MCRAFRYCGVLRYLVLWRGVMFVAARCSDDRSCDVLLCLVLPCGMLFGVMQCCVVIGGRFDVVLQLLL